MGAMDQETVTDGGNPYLLTLEDWRARAGLDLQGYFALLAVLDAERSAPALCRAGCEVEPGGVWCAHACPSLLVALELD